MIFNIRIIFTIKKDRRRLKDKKRQNDKKTNKDRIIKKTEGQKDKRGRRRFILSTWHCYDRVPKVLLRFILIMQQVVARLSLIVMLAMKS